MTVEPTVDVARVHPGIFRQQALADIVLSEPALNVGKKNFGTPVSLFDYVV